MNKRAVRLYKTCVDTTAEYNAEIFFLMQDGYAMQLFQCGRCGELFILDLEDPATPGKPYRQHLQGKDCPACGAALEESAYCYPRHYRTRSGAIGAADVPHNVSGTDTETLLSLYCLNQHNQSSRP